MVTLPSRDDRRLHGNLHARPTEVGHTATAARAGALPLTHVMPELEDERDDAEKLVRASFRGAVIWSHDLVRMPVQKSASPAT